MPKQEPIADNREHRANADSSAHVEPRITQQERAMRIPSFKTESEFQNAVAELAKDCGWEPFHIPTRAYEAGIPYSGFPDLVLRYQDENGKCTMVVAELKTNEGSVKPYQRQFLEDFAKQHIPTFVFRPVHWEYIKQMLKEGPPDSTGEIIEPSLPVVRSKKLPPPNWDDNRTVHDFLEEIFEFHHSGRGELAELRRLDPDKPDTATFWRLMARQRHLDCPATESKWALILHGMALMAPNTHSVTPVGKALFDGGNDKRTQAFYSDLRFKRLLSARGAMLRSLLSEVFRMMSTARQSFDWYEMASFILSKNEESQEESRYRFAREYYATEYERKHQ